MFYWSQIRILPLQEKKQKIVNSNLIHEIHNAKRCDDYIQKGKSN